jgi:regulator of replication initiation timing
MGLLDGLEKLINEHGSAAILRERIALLNEQHSLLEKKAAALEKQVVQLQSENEVLKTENSNLKEQVLRFEQKFSHNTNPRGYHCEHCGSTGIKRTGSRQDPVFGVVGDIQALFTCESCGKESSFLQTP